MPAAPDETDGSAPAAQAAVDEIGATQLERLVEEAGKRAAGAVVHGEAVTRAGVTVIPVAEVGYGFSFGGAGDAPGGGGVRARPRGFIEIRDGAVTYKPLRNPWAAVAVPLAAFLAGAVAPCLVRLLARRRLG
ncbi:sporulation protein [Streptomyces sp. G5(2025)]|uniref:sporulation protein n=1 Tax=Streptomyces sp. G5(2025) TaxID=3406628 RepID=UPI003C2AA711